MAATDRQKRTWASAPAGEIGRAGLSLSHSAFSKSHHLTNASEAFDGQLASGDVVRFLTHPFNVSRPKVGGDGKLDARLNIFNSGKEFMSEFRAAMLLIDEPIKMEVNEYLPGELISQTTGLVLQLGEIGLGGEFVTAVASSLDVYNLPFPNQIYTQVSFPGLSR